MKKPIRVENVLLRFPSRLLIGSVSILLAIAPSAAQQSASYKLTECTLNAGGHPANGVVLTSANRRLRLDAAGDPLVGTARASATFHADAGFTSAYPPPGQVLGLAFGDRTTLRWNAEKSVGSYNLYRDVLSALAGGDYGTCLQRDLPSETASDTGRPPTHSGWFYLVTARNRLNEEGTKGTNSAGAERPNSAPCP
jgi:hypothetical protein